MGKQFEKQKKQMDTEGYIPPLARKVSTQKHTPFLICSSEAFNCQGDVSTGRIEGRRDYEELLFELWHAGSLSTSRGLMIANAKRDSQTIVPIGKTQGFSYSSYNLLGKELLDLQLREEGVLIKDPFIQCALATRGQCVLYVEDETGEGVLLEASDITLSGEMTSLLKSTLAQFSGHEILISLVLYTDFHPYAEWINKAANEITLHHASIEVDCDGVRVVPTEDAIDNENRDMYAIPDDKYGIMLIRV